MRIPTRTECDSTTEVPAPLVPVKRSSGILRRVGLLLGILLLARGGLGRDLLAHFYYLNDPSSLRALQTHYRQVSLVSPAWFVVDQSGRLQTTLDPAVIAWARTHGVALMPLLVNENFRPEIAHTVLTDPQIQSDVVGGILKACILHRFYGIEFDFEAVPTADRPAYTQFIRRLAGQFHGNYLRLGVAVPAPLASAPSGGSSGNRNKRVWPVSAQSGAFDYHALAEAADFLPLMTYDQHIQPADPGPLASLPWVDACTRKVLDWVPAEKLLLGVPLYYRDWFGKSVREGGYLEALSLISKWRVPIEYDPKEGEPSVKFQDGNVAHTICFENARSLREKIRLVKRYRLLGFSAWRLGYEDPAAWKESFPKARRRLP